MLAGDNAVVIGLAAAGLPKDQRNKAIFVGIIAATVLRIAFAGVATQLLEILGLLLIGGILLLWVCWKMWRELMQARAEQIGAESGHRRGPQCRRHGGGRRAHARPSARRLADHRGRYLDVARQCLAVAGAAREHPIVLVFGLALSIALMGFAASFIAKLLQKYHWIAYVDSPSFSMWRWR